jgi:cell wall-associated NlpC family hydrolase
VGEGCAAIVATERSADGIAGGRLLSGGAGLRVIATICVAASAALALPAVPAQAKPKETLSQAKAKLDKLNSQVDHLDNKFNKAKDEWKAAKAKLDTLNKSVGEDKKTYEQMRERVAQLAASAYKSGGQAGDIPTLVSAKNPQDILDQISIFTQVSRNRSSEVTQFLNAAQMLQRQQAQAQQATDDLSQKKNALLSEQKKIKKTVSEQQKLVYRLGGGGSTTIGGTYNGPASGNARTVLKWAYSKLGTPYVYGGTGPNGYDCSGFVMMAWRQAGVSLPRVVPDQYNATRRVARADLAPGDLVFFDSLGHVGLYVGGGTFIHAPHTGSSVKTDSINDSYYSSHYAGAGRP